MIIGSEAPVTHPSINPKGAQERAGTVGYAIAPKIIRIREKITTKNNDSPDIPSPLGSLETLADAKLGEDEYVLGATDDVELGEDEFVLGANDDLSVDEG